MSTTSDDESQYETGTKKPLAEDGEPAWTRLLRGLTCNLVGSKPRRMEKVIVKPSSQARSRRGGLFARVRGRANTKEARPTSSATQSGPSRRVGSSMNRNYRMLLLGGSADTRREMMAQMAAQATDSRSTETTSWRPHSCGESWNGTIPLCTIPLNIEKSEGGGHIHIFDSGHLPHLKRASWISYFETMHCVVYLVDLDGYDQALPQNRTLTRLTGETLPCFQSIARSRWFADSALVVSFVGMGKLRDSLSTAPLSSVAYPEYEGDRTAVDAVAAHLMKLFVRSGDGRENIWVQASEMDDPEAGRAVMGVVREAIVDASLRHAEI